MNSRVKYRILEIIPGLLIWLTLILSVVLSFWTPLYLIYFIILYDLYWLFKVFYFIVNLTASWRNLRHDRKIDWEEKVRALPNWQRIYHLIFLPTYKEETAIIRLTLQSIVANNYPGEKMIIVLAGEERGGKDEFLARAEELKKEFGDKFYKFLVFVHPKDLPDEIPGKGSNDAYAAAEARKLIDEWGIPYEDIIVSTFDIDTIVDPQYFSYLTHKYLTVPNPTRSSYQPIAFYSNNIWQSPGMVRVAAFGTTFWLMMELVRPEYLFTFSSHSMPFKALVDVGYWQKNIVSEDSRIFLQCLMHYNGDYRVTPMYVGVSMNTVAIDNYWRSLKNLYKQQRRWAWGVENFPYMVTEFAKRPLISAWKKFAFIWKQLEGMYSWVTAPLIIFILGRLPFYVASEATKKILIVQTAPFILEILMTLSMAGVFISALFSLFFLPPRPPGHGVKYILSMILQWVFLPVSLIIFGSFPAADAQTRLMIGKYLGFWVTEKKKI